MGVGATVGAGMPVFVGSSLGYTLGATGIVMQSSSVTPAAFAAFVVMMTLQADRREPIAYRFCAVMSAAQFLSMLPPPKLSPSGAVCPPPEKPL